MTRSHLGTLLSIVLLALAGCGAPDVPRTDADPDAVLDEAVRGGALPAIAVAVVQDGGVVYRHVAGVRKQGDPTKVALTDAFHLGSNTKAMTALLVGTFVEQGALRWDSTIAELLQGVVEYRPEYASVTLEQLLSHSSGITDESVVNVDALHAYFESKTPVTEDRERAAAKALAAAPKSAPGTTFEYANVNYVIVGVVLEHQSGKTWEALMQERLFGPLGMASAGFGVPGTPGKVDAPWGHALAPVEPGPTSDLPPVLGPAGLVHANLDDVLRELSLYFTGGKLPDGTALVSEQTLGQLQKPRVPFPGGKAWYGLGWGMLEHPKGMRLSHTGSNGRFLAYFAVVPSTRSALVFLTNRGGGEAEAETAALCRYLLAHFDL